MTVIEALNVPAAVGVPLIVPPLLIERPLGRPLADQVYGDIPPVAARFVAYVVAIVPGGRVAVEIASGGGAGAGGGTGNGPLKPTISMA